MKIEIKKDETSMKMAAMSLFPADLRDGRKLVGLVERDGMTGGAAVLLPNGVMVEISAGVLKSLPKQKMGRPPITEGDLTEKKSVTLRASTWAKIESWRKDRESISACLDRIVCEALKKEELTFLNESFNINTEPPRRIPKPDT